MLNSGGLLDQILDSHTSEKKAASSAPRKAMSWARISTDEQEEPGLSNPGQMQVIAQFAGANNTEFAYKFTIAESAYHRKRPEFERMIALAKTEKLPVFVWDFSRLSRNHEDGMSLVRELRRMESKSFQ